MSKDTCKCYHLKCNVFSGVLKAWHWMWKAVARAGAVAGLGYAAWIGLKAGDVYMTLIGLVGLLLLGFWSYIEWIIHNRNIKLGKDGFEITKTGPDPSPPSSIFEADQSIAAFAGCVRDNFIYLGNHYFEFANRRASVTDVASFPRDWLTAYEHYAAANRLKSSILTAVRCMQCLAQLGEGHDPLILAYYDQALWHAECGPREDIRGRMNFVTLVSKYKTARWTPDFVKKLRDALKQSISSL